MYISKKNRAKIKDKFGGLCAYTGTPLEDDWQVEHIDPVRRNWWENSSLNETGHDMGNMVPTQKVVNHYKHSLPLESYRERLLTLHERLKKLPKNPRTEKGSKRKAYMLEVAGLFGITEDKPFKGKFYFETLKEK